MGKRPPLLGVYKISVYTKSMVKDRRSYICYPTSCPCVSPRIWTPARMGISLYICAGMAAYAMYYMRIINVLSMWYVSTLTGVSTMYRGATAGIISTVVLIIVLLVLPIYPIHHIVLSGHLGLIAFGNRFVLVSY